MEKRYIDAFYEVYQIINMLYEKPYIKIPISIIDKFKQIAQKSTASKVIK